MTTVASPVAATAAPTTTAAKPPRFDLYAAIHKALRAFMADTLGRLGAVDLDDDGERAAVFAQVQALLDACRSHVDKENTFVHPALEARRAGHSLRIAGEHDEHLEAIAGLEAELAALRASPTPAAAHRVYRHLAVFVGDNLVHMNVEETAHNEALWAAYSDAELGAIHQRILAAVAPDELAVVLRWMVPAMTPAERAGMLGEMQQQMPPECMRSVLDIVRPHLGDNAWAKLARALRIPVAPGLVSV